MSLTNEEYAQQLYDEAEAEVKSVKYKDIYYLQYKEITSAKDISGKAIQVYTGDIDIPFVKCPECLSSTKLLVKVVMVIYYGVVRRNLRLSLIIVLLIGVR